MKIGLDLDGVMYCWHSDIREILKKYHDHHVPEKFTVEWVQQDLELPNGWWHQYIGTEVFNLGSVKHPESIDVLNRLHQDNEIHVITARICGEMGEIATSTTEDWLAKHDVPHDSLNVVEHYKAPTCKELGIDIMIDDAIHVYKELMQSDGKTIPALFTEHWNEDYPARFRINGWNDAERFIGEWTNR